MVRFGGTLLLQSIYGAELEHMQEYLGEHSST